MLKVRQMSHSSHAERLLCRDLAGLANSRGLQKQLHVTNPRGTALSILKHEETASGSLETWLQNWL